MFFATFCNFAFFVDDSRSVFPCHFLLLSVATAALCNPEFVHLRYAAGQRCPSEWELTHFHSGRKCWCFKGDFGCFWFSLFIFFFVVLMVFVFIFFLFPFIVCIPPHMVFVIFYQIFCFLSVLGFRLCDLLLKRAQC